MTAANTDPILVTARSYEAAAASWHEAHRGEDRSVSRADGYDRFAALVPPGGLVLELGCGSGLDAPALLGRGLRVLGLDTSTKMLRLARAVDSPTGMALCADMRALPLADNSLAAMLAVGSIHHLPKTEAPRAIAEVSRVLRPGGIFALAIERGSFEGYVEDQEGVAGRRWYAYYEAGELEPNVVVAGLTIIDRLVGGAGAHTAGFISLTARKP